MTEEEGRNEAGLARAYQQAATSDAEHELAGGGPGKGGRDPTLVTTGEVPDVPGTDVARPDLADGEAQGRVPRIGGAGSAIGSEAEMSGLEPGEMAGDAEPKGM